MEMTEGPLAFTSRFAPESISADQEALLAYAGGGISGHALGDLCYAKGQGGNIMAGLVGRTVASGDAIQTVSLVVTNDSGTWWMKRPQDFDATGVRHLISLSEAGKYRELYERTRVQLSDRRSAPPNAPLFNIAANRWSAYAPGTTCFLPINDLTFMYINGLLEIFNEETGAFVLDERNHFLPAGLGRFAKRRGGHLEDDPAAGRVATVQQVETMVTEFVTIEQGMIAQNLGLMAQALGLGGFPFFANHPFGWFQALSFRFQHLPASQYLGAGFLARTAMRLLRRDQPVPLPVGLEHQGEILLRSYAPPYFANMSAAVDAVVAAKFGPAGGLKRPDANSHWKHSHAVTEAIPKVSDGAISATKAYCEYIWSKYHRFPAYLPPFRTTVAFQVGRLDLEFYDRFYQPGAVSESHRRDFESWKSGIKP